MNASIWPSREAIVVRWRYRRFADPPCASRRRSRSQSYDQSAFIPRQNGAILAQYPVLAVLEVSDLIDLSRFGPCREIFRLPATIRTIESDSGLDTFLVLVLHVTAMLVQNATLSLSVFLSRLISRPRIHAGFYPEGFEMVKNRTVWLTAFVLLAANAASAQTAPVGSGELAERRAERLPRPEMSPRDYSWCYESGGELTCGTSTCYESEILQMSTCDIGAWNTSEDIP